MQNLSQKNIWLNIDKPIGYSSAKVVAIIKRVTGAKKVGHAGTLDPFASGVLPIALNKATKTCQYISDARKKYFFRITWGEFRDTDDVEGKVTESSLFRPKTENIISVLPNFLGKIKQTPSRFSAIKIDGKRAYELARKEIDFKIKERQVEIFSLKLISNSAEFAEFESECSKGTYIRSLSRDICKRLSACGYVSVLTRLMVGNFMYEKRISLDLLKLVTTYNARFLDGSMLCLHDVLDFMPEVKLDDLDASKFKNGQIITINPLPLDCKSLSHKFLEPFAANIVLVVNNVELIGLASFEKNLLKPVNVF
ncbi:MAG: tRNA pseudouridine(55) synthase TruB [Proteobacteria bacterium]|nr:tRNA pseudouridine(55) synthase TruB [Pseudomonadota bacterium]